MTTTSGPRAGCRCDRSTESQVGLPSRDITYIHSANVIALLHHDEAPSLAKGQLEIFRQHRQRLPIADGILRLTKVGRNRVEIAGRQY
jgi:hypothetical protein